MPLKKIDLMQIICIYEFMTILKRSLNLLLIFSVVISLDAETTAKPNSTTPSNPLKKSPLQEVSTLPTVVVQDSYFNDGLDQSNSSGSRLNLSRREVPSSVYSVSQAQVKERQFRDTQDVVNSIVGMTGGNSAGNGSTYSSRGFVGSRVHQYYDGFKIFNPGMSSRLRDSFNYESVEVIKGPSAMAFGEGGVGGAVNYIAKQPNRDRFEGEFFSSYGSFETSRMGVGIGGPIENTPLSFRTDFSRSSTKGYLDLNEQERYQSTGAIRYDVNPDFHTTLYWDWFYDEEESYWGTPLTQEGNIDKRIARRSYNVEDARKDSDNIFLRLKSEWQVEPEIKVQNTLYGYNGQREWMNVEGLTYNQSAGTIRYRDLGFVQHKQYLVGNQTEAIFDQEIFSHKNKFLVGLDLSRTEFFRIAHFPGSSVTVDAFNPRPLNYSDVIGSNYTRGHGADYDIFTASGYIDNQFSILDNLKLLMGGRYDRVESDNKNRSTGLEFGRYFNPMTGRVGLTYDPIKEVTLYSSYTRGASTPASLNTNQTALLYGVEETEQVEVGIKNRFWNDRIETGVSYFNINKERTRTVAASRTAVPDGRDLVDGFEFDFVARPYKVWTVGGNLSLLSSEIQESPRANLNGLISANVPKEVANLYSTIEFIPQWKFGVNYRYVGDRAAVDGSRFVLQQYHLIDLSLSYEYKNWDFSLVGRNIGDAFYAYWSENEYTDTTSGAPQVLVGAPASIEGRIGWKF